jgi:DNA-binding protein H-NS
VREHVLAAVLAGIIQFHHLPKMKMTNHSLASLSLSDLHQLTADVKRELQKRDLQKIAAARAQVLSIAQSVGMDVRDLMGKHSKDKYEPNKVASKYRNPANSRQEWSGPK